MLLSLLNNNRISRVELARQTSLSTTTITNLVGELMEEGIVIEKGIEEVKGRRRVGRPRQVLNLVPGARYVIGVQIETGILRIVATNLFAEVIATNLSSFKIGASADEVLAQVVEIVDNLISSVSLKRSHILGVGVGTPGKVNFQHGLIVIAEGLGWEKVPVQTMLEERLSLPVVADNHIRAMAIGEAFFGVGRYANSLIFVYGGLEVGAGIIVGRQVFRGSNGGAGEIGHIVLIQEGELCRCGKRGCLETLVSETAIVQAAIKLAEVNPSGLLAENLKSENLLRPIEKVFNAAREGDIQALELIRQCAHYLGNVLSTLVKIINPELILLGGILGQGHDLILPAAEAMIQEMTLGSLGETVKIYPTGFGWRAGVIGAASLALMNLFYLES